MELIQVDPLQPDPEVIARAADIIRAGDLVAFPTETVYGLGANALDETAVLKIFQVKGRPRHNPLIVHVAETAEARDLARHWPDLADRLGTAFWPGPLTLIVEKRAFVPDSVTAGLPTVAVRVPAHPVALALLRAAGVPIAAPSANRFTAVSPTTAQHVVKELGGAVELILDGGATTVGLESTVLDLTREPPRLLRPGGVSVEAIEAVAGRVHRFRPPPATAETPQPSPGTAARHYAPRATIRTFSPELREQARAAAERASHEGLRAGALVFHPLGAPLHHEILMPANPAQYAERLYAALHTLDDERCDVIFLEQVPTAPEWLAIQDRLARAAATA